jgi:peptidoglycan/xylan/chitin deacetylase (PgdA/CDA1 family)
MTTRWRDARVVLGFDMETDIGSWTPYYEGLTKGTPRLIEVLGKGGAKATFFFTGDSARQHPEVVRLVHKAGHEVGNHSLFHETVGDELFPIPGIKPLLPSEVRGRLGVAHEWITKAAGVEPVSFRAPRLWGSTAVVNALEEMGYVADASYPLFFYEDRLAPYYPSRGDWTRPGRSAVLEIPNTADMGMKSRDRYGRDRDLWPLFRTAGADAVMKRLDSFALVVARHRLPLVVCLYMHPWEFISMPQGWIHYGEGSVKPDPFLVESCGRVAARELGRLIGRLAEDWNARFVTAGQLAAKWKA